MLFLTLQILTIQLLSCGRLKCIEVLKGIHWHAGQKGFSREKKAECLIEKGKVGQSLGSHSWWRVMSLRNGVGWGGQWNLRWGSRDTEEEFPEADLSQPSIGWWQKQLKHHCLLRPPSQLSPRPPSLLPYRHQTPSAGDKDTLERNEEKNKPEKEWFCQGRAWWGKNWKSVLIKSWETWWRGR